MDQVVEDCMTGLAEADQGASMEGMVGKQGEEEMAEILGKSTTKSVQLAYKSAT